VLLTHTQVRRHLGAARQPPHSCRQVCSVCVCVCVCVCVTGLQIYCCIMLYMCREKDTNTHTHTHTRTHTPTAAFLQTGMQIYCSICRHTHTHTHTHIAHTHTHTHTHTNRRTHANRYANKLLYYVVYVERVSDTHQPPHTCTPTAAYVQPAPRSSALY